MHVGFHRFTRHDSLSRLGGGSREFHRTAEAHRTETSADQREPTFRQSRLHHKVTPTPYSFICSRHTCFRFDQFAVLTESDARDFELQHNIPVYLSSNVYSTIRTGTSYLNLIAETLFKRDQKLTGQAIA